MSQLTRTILAPTEIEVRNLARYADVPYGDASNALLKTNGSWTRAVAVLEESKATQRQRRRPRRRIS